MIVVLFSYDWLLLDIIWEFPWMRLKFGFLLCNFLVMVRQEQLVFYSITRWRYFRTTDHEKKNNKDTLKK